MTPKTLTTIDVARLLGVATTSVGRLHADGLAGCVVTWGSGRGRMTLYDATWIARYQWARECVQGRRCNRCSGLLAGLTVVGRHLQLARHGLHEDCDNGCIVTHGRTCQEPTANVAAEQRKRKQARKPAPRRRTTT